MQREVPDCRLGSPAPNRKFGAMASDDKRRPRQRHPEKGFRPYHSVSVPKSVDLVHGCSAQSYETLHLRREQMRAGVFKIRAMIAIVK